VPINGASTSDSRVKRTTRSNVHPGGHWFKTRWKEEVFLRLNFVHILNVIIILIPKRVSVEESNHLWFLTLMGTIEEAEVRKTRILSE